MKKLSTVKRKSPVNSALSQKKRESAGWTAIIWHYLTETFNKLGSFICQGKVLSTRRVESKNTKHKPSHVEKLKYRTTAVSAKKSKQAAALSAQA